MRYDRGLRCILLVIGGPFVLGSCGLTEPEAACEPTTRAVEAEVTVGSTVEFDWSPGCEVFFVLVEAAGDPEDIWGLITEGRNGIAPPVTFGRPVAGAEFIEKTYDVDVGQQHVALLGGL